MARILARDPEDLRETDISQPVLDTLMRSKVREVHMIGRRGPAQAKFTTKELRELGELHGVDLVAYGGETDLDAFDPTGESARLAETDRHVRGNYTVIREWTERQPAGGARRLFVRFWLRPTEIHGPGQVSGLTLERTRLDDDGKFVGTGTLRHAQRADGAAQRGIPERAAARRAVRRPLVRRAERGGPGARARTAPRCPASTSPGWLKRGPTGVIGTNKSDAAETVRALLADLAGGPGPDDVQLPRAGLLRYPEAGPDGAAGPRPRRASSSCWRPAGSARSATPTGWGSRTRRRSSPPPWAAAPGSSWAAARNCTGPAAWPRGTERRPARPGGHGDLA